MGLELLGECEYEECVTCCFHPSPLVWLHSSDCCFLPGEAFNTSPNRFSSFLRLQMRRRRRRRPLEARGQALLGLLRRIVLAPLPHNKNLSLKLQRAGGNTNRRLSTASGGSYLPTDIRKDPDLCSSERFTLADFRLILKSLSSDQPFLLHPNV